MGSLPTSQQIGPTDGSLVLKEAELYVGLPLPSELAAQDSFMLHTALQQLKQGLEAHGSNIAPTIRHRIQH